MSSTISLSQIVCQSNATTTSFLKPGVSWLRCSCSVIPKNIYKFIYKTKFTVDSNNIIRCEVPLNQFSDVVRFMCYNNPKDIGNLIFKDQTEIAFALRNTSVDSVYNSFMSSELTDTVSPSKIKDMVYDMFVYSDSSLSYMTTIEGSTKRDKITIGAGFATINDVPAFASTIKLEFKYDSRKILFFIDSINFYITSEFMNYPNGISKMFLQTVMDNVIQPVQNVEVLLSNLFNCCSTIREYIWDNDKREVGVNTIFTNNVPHYDCPAAINNIDPEKFDSNKCTELVNENIDFLVDHCNKFV
jgi:hypothetical protein